MTTNHKEEIKVPNLIPIQARVDDRGFLWQLFEGCNINRCYVVGNFDKNTIRGFHLHREESKRFFIASGSAKFVTVNEKDTTIQTFVLTEKRPTILHVPPRYNHL